ncbi:MAG: bifunctional 5,10-methylene-tetrahydrofolate dehydrogenase/5,10-methylene-tetrahydrofolate cyclohydrolase [Actinobacteria bacterium]|nr:bifunctional 5,10-methylene-tetrahydrofolate dehydrogenase/5,10-methylene-tetrahydrofolate cyclohydrolase [Actinomycetota bacterium]
MLWLMTSDGSPSPAPSSAEHSPSSKHEQVGAWSAPWASKHRCDESKPQEAALLHRIVPAQRLDGKACAAEVEAALLKRVKTLTANGTIPHLAVLIVGDDPASHVYVNSKVKMCERLGIRSTHIALPATTTEETVRQHVAALNQQEDLDGILIQSPLPDHMDEEALTDLILPSKDVDGFHPQNLGRLVQGRRDGLLPCTPSGVMRMLDWAGIDLKGKRAVVLGRSRIVGMPAALLLAARGADATVTVAHSKTEDLPSVCAEADLVIGAVLVAGDRAPIVVDEQMVASMRPGSVIVDVAVDQGGCIATTRETTHSAPTFVEHDVIHYAVGNMPGAVPHTSTLALTNATLPYIGRLIDTEDPRGELPEDLRAGLNVSDGRVVNDIVASSLN